MTIVRLLAPSTLLFSGLALLCALPVSAEEFSFPALREGSVTLTIPATWQPDEEVFSDPSGDAHSARFIDAKDGNFVMLISVIVPLPAPAAAPLTPATLRASVARFAGEAKLRSVETEIPVEEFSSEGLFGAYFSATDRAPDIDEFKFLTQGFAALGTLPITFTALSNRDPDLAREELLAAISSMRLKPPK